MTRTRHRGLVSVVHVFRGHDHKGEEVMSLVGGKATFKEKYSPHVYRK
jgi:hypothetical protein